MPITFLSLRVFKSYIPNNVQNAYFNRWDDQTCRQIHKQAYEYSYLSIALVREMFTELYTSITLREQSQCSLKVITEHFQGSWINVKKIFRNSYKSFKKNWGNTFPINLGISQSHSTVVLRLGIWIKWQLEPLSLWVQVASNAPTHKDKGKKATHFGPPCWK